MKNSTSRLNLTLAVCFIVALLEGLDLQSTGVAGPSMARAFGFTAAQMGLVFGVSGIGLLPGSAIGGRLADKIGRKTVLMLSVAMFGIFSLLTAHAWSFESLVLARFLTGLGMGAAMPNLIALCSESAAQGKQGTAVGIMYCGMPFGAAFASLSYIFSTGEAAWRNVFYMGGFGPLLIVPLIAFCLPESARFLVARQNAHVRGGSTSKTMNALWGEGRTITTLALWGSYFGTLVVLYFLMNWLPSLLVKRGLSHAQAGSIHLMFNIGSGVGAVFLSHLMDKRGRTRSTWIAYGGTIVSLLFLAFSGDRLFLSIGAFLVGVFVVGAQALLYALAGESYPTIQRGTGVGAAVSAGRVGAIVGPMAAGQLLAVGQSSNLLLGASIALVFLSAFAAMVVANRLSMAQPDERSALEKHSAS